MSFGCCFGEEEEKKTWEPPMLKSCIFNSPQKQAAKDEHQFTDVQIACNLEFIFSTDNRAGGFNLGDGQVES